MSKYNCVVGGSVRMSFEGDFRQASSPVTIDGNSTPFQVADFRHYPKVAADKLNEWCRSEGGEAWGEDEEVEVIKVGE
jgi:hypothetical protein